MVALRSYDLLAPLGDDGRYILIEVLPVVENRDLRDPDYFFSVIDLFCRGELRLLGEYFGRGKKLEGNAYCHRVGGNEAEQQNEGKCGYRNNDVVDGQGKSSTPEPSIMVVIVSVCIHEKPIRYLYFII